MTITKQDADKELLALSKEEACAVSIEELTELYNETNEKDLDMPKLEFILINAFGNGVYWANLKHKKEITQLKEEQEQLKDYIADLEEQLLEE